MPPGDELAGLFFVWLKPLPNRVVVYIDAENARMGARDAFHPVGASFISGQFEPLAMGELLVERSPAGYQRELKQVRMYTGRPDATKHPKNYGAHMSQCAAWESAGVHVAWRPLRYPPDFPASKPQEKGIDVQLAVDLVTHAVSRYFDVAIVVSTDTDLRPALEWVALRTSPGPRVELAAWKSPTSNRRIHVEAPRRIWCHWLDLDDYKAVRDPTDYTRAQRP